MNWMILDCSNPALVLMVTYTGSQPSAVFVKFYDLDRSKNSLTHAERNNDVLFQPFEHTPRQEK